MVQAYYPQNCLQFQDIISHYRISNEKEREYNYLKYNYMLANIIINIYNIIHNLNEIIPTVVQNQQAFD